MNYKLEGWSFGRRVFLFVNGLFLLALTLTMIIPLWNTVAVSLSNNFASMQAGIKLWPTHFSLEGYATIWQRLELWLPFQNSVLVTVIGTVLHVSFCALAGYVLCQRELPGRKLITTLILFTMMIPGQAVMIPLYVLNAQLGLINTLTALIVSGLVSGFSILLMRNFFQNVPSELLEAATADGAGHFRIFFTICLPLAKAGLATVTLFEFVSRWNDLSSALLYINDSAKYTLQVALNTIINQSEAMSSNFLVTDNVKRAGVVIAILPLIVIYPFVQRYFVQGIMIGAVKE